MDLNFSNSGEINTGNSSSYVDNGFVSAGQSDMATKVNGISLESKEDVKEGDSHPTYAEAFPPLPITPNEQKAPMKWGPGETNQVKVAAKPVNRPTPSIRSSTVTQMFRVPYEERRYKELTALGESDIQNRDIRDIMNRTGTQIEASVAKDQSLTVLISGRRDAVAQARRFTLEKLQTQAELMLPIPREHHRFILGKGGKNLKDLELSTATKVHIPRDKDFVRIIGTKEGIDRARHEMQLISDEQAKLAFERLQIPKIYHPFIAGPSNNTMAEIMKRTGARINIPPPSVNKNELTVAGEKEGVQTAVDMITRIFEEKKRKCNTVSVEVRKTQHKYIIGPRGIGLQEILAATGVSVEMPPSDTPQETITLRGEPDKLGTALTLVYEKANSVVFSEVSAPRWLHRFIIGRNGQNIRKITQDLAKVHIEFAEESDKIKLEGPPAEVEAAQQALEDSIEELKNTMDFAEIEVEQRWHPHIIGKSGSNVNRIKTETGTSIQIPSDNEKSNIIRIEGSPDGVTVAKTEILQMVEKMENEKSRDIIIEQRFHRNIIGTGGEKIREIRDKFNEVQISFPESNTKSDIVTIRGAKQDVDKAYAYLKKMNAELIAANYRLELSIFKKFHRNIIGKGGSTIRKIKEETNTQIEIPTESSSSDVIIITGYKEQVEKAKVKILEIENGLANIISVEITIPHKIHTSLIGAKGRLIRAIMEECGDVHIHFPPEGSNSDKVTIRGPNEEVEKAKNQLTELASEKQLSSFTAEVRAKPEHHRYLIGRGGINIQKIRDKTSARIIFPGAKDEDRELITIMGKKESVEAAKEEILQKIKDLNNIVQGEVDVDPKHHRHFIARRAQVLREIADDFGGVSVSFPREPNSSRVILKGATGCVEGAKQRILEIVQDLESMITIDCVIPQKYHRAIMGPKGFQIQEITAKFNVQIKFPERPVANGNVKPEGEAEENVNGEHVEGEVEPEEPKSPPATDIIVISGKSELVEQAKQAMIDLVPVSQVISIPFDYHRYIIGTKGSGVRRFMDEFGVDIVIPPAKDESDQVVVSGAPRNVDDALDALRHRVQEIEAENEERELRSFKLVLTVPPKYHPKIIGRRGLVVQKLRAKYNIQITVPPADVEQGESEEASKIILTGLEEDCERARDEIMGMINELEQQITLEISIDHRIHSRIIGQKGRTVRKIMEKFNVDIRFPRTDNQDLVVITGMEDNAEDCKEYMLMLEEEYIDDIRERIEERDLIAQYMSPRSKSETDEPVGFVVREAPWNEKAAQQQQQQQERPRQDRQIIPDTSNAADFPSLGASASKPQKQAAWGAWGRR